MGGALTVYTDRHRKERVKEVVERYGRVREGDWAIVGVCDGK